MYQGTFFSAVRLASPNLDLISDQNMKCSVTFFQTWGQIHEALPT